MVLVTTVVITVVLVIVSMTVVPVPAVVLVLVALVVVPLAVVGRVVVPVSVRRPGPATRVGCGLEAMIATTITTTISVPATIQLR